MTNRDPKRQCPVCRKWVRQLGKHMNQKHPDEARYTNVSIREPEVR